MDKNHKGVKIDEINNLESPKVVMIEESDGEDESQALLPSDKGELSTKPEKPRRKVQWLDRNGHKLAEIVEFQPSDVSDSDEDDSDSCICRIM
ncbi:hypothetical protein CDL12_09418 [Handroanthus impetiginosus]|uniref:Uncharacterized protein n=1 Tax=Handroanthus impetiginosus TaxID=429701 RepID=A0A2G9HK59_9LAMI|nr:hypothetical protein CDL12_09418 [Handroanthus impetiginosus]